MVHNGCFVGLLTLEHSSSGRGRRQPEKLIAPWSIVVSNGNFIYLQLQTRGENLDA